MTILLAVLGIICVGGAIMLMLAHRRWKSAAVRVDGEIIDVRRTETTSTDDDSNTTTTTFTYYPKVRFQAEGRVVEFASKVGSSRRREVGESVAVYYQKENPEDAQIEGLSLRPVLAILLGVAGVILLVAAVMVHR